jgi:lipopolysaccharide/colanic/teichoic acid biosynthesis glycosyltransferase
MRCRELKHGLTSIRFKASDRRFVAFTARKLAFRSSRQLTIRSFQILERKISMQLPTRGRGESISSTPPWIAVPLLVPTCDDQIREVVVEIPNPSKWTMSVAKRILDLSVAFLALILLAVPLLAIAVCVRLSSRGPALFIQGRVGRGGRLFAIYKFRSMAVGSNAGLALTRSGDIRVTSFGSWMRRFKLDELPQFYNILRGEMSLVGPRPKLPFFESLVNMPYRPGITGAATLAFRSEEEILSTVQISQLEQFYAREIKPLKAQLDTQYMSNATFWSDMGLIAKTFLTCIAPGKASSMVERGTAMRKSPSMKA